MDSDNTHTNKQFISCICWPYYYSHISGSKVHHQCHMVL